MKQMTLQQQQKDSQPPKQQQHKFNKPNTKRPSLYVPNNQSRDISTLQNQANQSSQFNHHLHHSNSNYDQANSLDPDNSNNSEYRTSINQLISGPYQQNAYSIESIFSSIYQLSEYLFAKKISQFDNNGSLTQLSHSINFQQYLKEMHQELVKYDRFKKARAKESDLMNQKGESGNESNDEQSEQKSLQSPTKKITPLKSRIEQSIESQLVKCFQKIPFIYFEQNFSLDFSNFQSTKESPSSKISKLIPDLQSVKSHQQILNDNLDLVQINLFAQIHRKFEDYFRAAANFDYLRESINVQLVKLAQTRKSTKKVQKEFVENSQQLRKKIVQRNNYEKLLKKIKTVKSLKKLPSFIESILQSSLPYECLELLQSTKKSIKQVQGLVCVQGIVNNIRSCETIVQLGLNKRYTDELYLYLQEPFNTYDYKQIWMRIAQSCSLVQREHQNYSTLSHRSMQDSRHDRSGNGMLLDELVQSGGNFLQDDQPKKKPVRRQQGKQYQISMILLQSFDFINFPVDMTKLKVSNVMRVFSKNFQKNLLTHFQTCLQRSRQNKIVRDLSFEGQSPFQVESKRGSQIAQPEQPFSLDSANIHPIGKSKNENSSNPTDQSIHSQLKRLSDKLTVQFYVKHIKSLNTIFQEVLNRYLGYVLTLVTEYQERLSKGIDDALLKRQKKSGSAKSITSDLKSSKVDSNQGTDTTSNPKPTEDDFLKEVRLRHSKFLSILQEQLSILPSMFKIIEQKIKYFLALKNMSNTSPIQFIRWTSILRQWQKWFDLLMENNPLFNYEYNCFPLSSCQQDFVSTEKSQIGQAMMEQLIRNTVTANLQRSMNILSSKSLMSDLTVNYLQGYTANVKAQLQTAIQQDTWQSVQIPQQFVDVVSNIVSKNQESHNMSITILNTSGNDSSFNNLSRMSATEYNEPVLKIKVLKNYILLSGQRFKLTMSFLLLAEFLQQFVRIGRSLLILTGNDNQEQMQGKHSVRIQTALYTHIYELVETFSSACREMILEKKALTFQSIKGNNITVKHICLLNNCLVLLQKIIKQTPAKDLLTYISPNYQDLRQQCLYKLQHHSHLLNDKISTILNKKMESLITKVTKSNTEQHNKYESLLPIVQQSNKAILTILLQITQIIDEYLDFESCDKILRNPFQMFVQRYFKFIILKGKKFQQEMGTMLQRMRFLNKYFKKELAAMQREIQ